MTAWFRYGLFGLVVIATAYVVVHPLCFGCGGLTFAEGTTAAEMEAVEQRMVEVVRTAVFVSVTAIILGVAIFEASRWPMRSRDRGDDP